MLCNTSCFFSLHWSGIRIEAQTFQVICHNPHCYLHLFRKMENYAASYKHLRYWHRQLKVNSGSGMARFQLKPKDIISKNLTEGKMNRRDALKFQICFKHIWNSSYVSAWCNHAIKQYFHIFSFFSKSMC